MSHELTTRANGLTEMAYVGETPWHGLGQELTEGASIDDWKTAAGMDWKVQRSKVRYFADAAGAQQFEMEDRHVLLRSDDKKALGIVSPEFKIVQPGAVLEFFRDLTEDAGMHLHTAGTLFGGRKFWALAKVAEATIQGADKVGGYLLLATACDGSMATEIRETSIRVVCNNTLSMARSVGAKRDVIRITHREKFNAESVKTRMLDAGSSFASHIALAQELSRKRVTNAMAEEFVRKLLRPDEVLIEGEEVRAPKGEADILRLFKGEAIGYGMSGSGSAWTLVNAVTQWVDHVKGGKSESHRLDSAFFGSGDDLKNRAFDLAFTI
jgi:phage/plasmid-like protein (TIGR03299 family)